MLHAEIERLTDEQARDAYDLLRLARESAATAEDTAIREASAFSGSFSDASNEHAGERSVEAPNKGPLLALSEIQRDAPKDFSENVDQHVTGEKAERKPGESRDLMTMLLEVRFDAPADFSENLDLYASGEKSIDDVP
jgi:hypothetical protein